MPPAHEGGCLCGAVRLRAEGEPKWVSYCHCQSCRRHTGAPVAAWAGFERPQVSFTPEPTWFASSPGVRRAFCGRCGSSLAFQGERWPTETHICLGAFDDPEPLAPGGHACADERIAWMHISDPPT